LPPRLFEHPPSVDTGRELSPVFVRPDGAVLQTRRDPQTGVEIGEAEPGTVCGIAAYRFWADWWFVPHAHEWSKHRERLEQMAMAIVHLHPDEPRFKDALIDKLRIPSELKAIKDMYKPLNSNGTSLSVYAGPPSGKTLPRHRDRHCYGAPENRPVGWLLTGDSPLGTNTRFLPFEKSFETIKEQVGYLMLPHHGAAKNFNSKLLEFAESARLFVTVNAADFQNKIRPPQKTVRDKLKKRPLEDVSEEKLLEDFSGPVGGERRKERLLTW
jgi:hypothetical protein